MGKRLILVATVATLSLPPPLAVAEDEGYAPLEASEQQQVSEALQAVEDAWADMESATAERWRSAKETFDQAVIDLERTWEEVTADGGPPLAGEASGNRD